VEPEEVRSNRRALVGLLVITLVAAIAAGVGLVARIADDDAGRPDRSGASTLDGTREGEPSSDEGEDGDDGLGLIAITAVISAAGACVALPLLVARHRRRVAEASRRAGAT
jgi:hypothetical protein